MGWISPGGVKYRAAYAANNMFCLQTNLMHQEFHKTLLRLRTIPKSFAGILGTLLCLQMSGSLQHLGVGGREGVEARKHIRV